MTRKDQPLIEDESVLLEYTQEEAAALVEQWLATFGVKRNGVNTKAYLWHIFSGSRYASVSGKEAILLYEKQVAPEYIVLSNDRKTAFATKRMPLSSSPIFDDYYVFPANLAWTMAFTHEDGWLGPYFARHVNFAELNALNLEKVNKLRQAEVARSKGWI